MLKKLRLSRNEKLLLVFLIVFNLFSRLWGLDQVPATIPHDEMVYAVQAKSYQLQGTTLDQTHRPWYIKPFDRMYAELPATLMAFGYLLTDDPVAGAHLTSGLMGATLPFFAGWLVYLLWQKKRLAWAAVVLFTFNPLFWQMSRVGYDAFYSLWFYLVAACLFLQKKPAWQWLSVAIFVIGFFNYQGFKLLLVPWIFFLLMTKTTAQTSIWRSKKWFTQFIQTIFQQRIRILILVLGISLTLFYGLVLLPNQGGAAVRLNRTVFTDTEYLNQAVDTSRRQTLDNPFTPLMYNKATEAVSFMLHRLLGVFDLRLLFLLVEPSVSGFSVWTHGLFYWVEGALMFLGLAYLFQNRTTRPIGLLLMFGAVMLCLPALINSGSEWYLLRSMLSYFVLTLIASWGVFWLWAKSSLRIPFVLIYVLSVGYFAWQYAYRYPVISLDWGNFDERVVARYLDLTVTQNPELKIATHVIQPNYFYWSYILYGDQVKSENLAKLATTSAQGLEFKEAQFEYDNLVFTDGCQPAAGSQVVLGGVAMIDCLENNPAWSDRTQVRSIAAVMDSGERLLILNDQLCQDISLRSYVSPRTLSDFQVESMPREEFCQKWIVNQNI